MARSAGADSVDVVRRSAALPLPRPLHGLLAFSRASPAGGIGLALISLVILAVGLGPSIWTVPTDQQDLSRALADPSLAHPLGTDQFGRDILSRLLEGGRTSLTIGVLSVLIGAALGIGLGAAAGVYGGWIEPVAMRLVDAVLALPSIVQAVIFVAIIGRGIGALIIALGIYSAPLFARVAFGGSSSSWVRTSSSPTEQSELRRTTPSFVTFCLIW